MVQAQNSTVRKSHVIKVRNKSIWRKYYVLGGILNLKKEREKDEKKNKGLDYDLENNKDPNWPYNPYAKMNPDGFKM